MKKILLIIFFVSIIIPNYSYANGACSIKDNTAEVLLEYVKNNRIVVKNITKAIVEERNKKPVIKKEEEGIFKSNWDKIKDDTARAKSETISIFNEMFNFSGYYSYFNYFVTFPISNDVPYEVKRDYKLLDKENEGLLKYLTKVDKRGDSDIVVVDACKGVNKDCQLDNLTVKEIVGQLLQNSDNILDLYRLTIIGEDADFDTSKLILVDFDFDLGISDNYSISAVQPCIIDKGGFFETISESIENIKILNKQAEDGIEKWRDAWALLIGNKPVNEIQALEKKLLKEYLEESGISLDKQQILLNNLDKYNREGFTQDNNFLTNSINQITNSIKKALKDFQDEEVSDLFKLQKVKKTGGSYNRKEIDRAIDNRKITLEIQEKITELYESEIPFAQVGDVTTEKLQGEIIETHNTLKNTIEKLDLLIPYSVRTCEEQYGGGDCGDKK